MTNAILKQLAQPFAPRYISFKPGKATKDGTKCMALTYADLRAYQERLDELFGLDWSVRYTPWGDGRVICELTISGVTRCATGEMVAQDEANGMGGTVAEAQAMKRAAAQFGLGRYLYDLPSQWAEYDSQRKRISDARQKHLMEQYRAWYVRQVADTGNTNAGVPDACSESEAQATLPYSLLSQLHQLGEALYGREAWDEKRPALCKAASSGATESSKYLTTSQAQLLIDGLIKRLKEHSAVAV